MLIVPAVYLAAFDLMGPVIYFCMLNVLFLLLSPSFSSHSSAGGAVSLGVATPPPMAAG